MDILTLYAGQGALAVVRHAGEAIIIDSFFRGCGEMGAKLLETQLDRAMKGLFAQGLLLTGFDSDHCCPAGVELILSKYSPAWVMYPTYYKDTDCATEVFSIISRHEAKNRGSFRKISMRLDKIESRHLTGLSKNFSFEIFSPHYADMDSSNNSSIVLKLTGKGYSGFSYLITGDTENDRWQTINKLFGPYLQSDVMAAAHHGARTGVNAETVLLVSPNTVLISAGVESQYGHPHPQALQVYGAVAQHVFATNVEGGVSLFTKKFGADFQTQLAR